MALLKMAQPTKTTNIGNANTNITSTYLQHQQQVKPTMFHDFLGMTATDSHVVLAPKATDARVSEASPSASASFAGAAGRGPISSTSDLGSGQVGNHLEGIPYYGPRSEISGPEISNRMVGSKRSNSDSVFVGHESLESLHLMKVLRNSSVEERSRRSREDEVSLGMQSMRPSVSLISQAPTCSTPGGNASKWEQSVPVIGSAVQYGSSGGHFMPFLHQVSSNRFKDTNAGPSVISPAAADEGSRTGIKGRGILTSVNASNIPAEKSSSGVMPSGGRPKSWAHISDPESSVPPSRQGLTSTSRQMTIFYAGQAHVFDDVHPNKAAVIMSLAGSNGGSWSTTYSPKSTTRPASGEPEGVASMLSSREFQGRIAFAGNTSQGERGSIPTGVPLGAIVMGKEARNPEPSTDDKRDV